MGSRLENNKKKVEDAREIENRGLEAGEKDAEEIREIKSILDGAETDVDEDIIEAIAATREAAKSEGASHMQSEVHSILDEGYATANEAISEGADQAAKSQQSAEMFRSVSGTSEFGRNSAESSASSAENLATQFENQVEEAQKGMEEAEKRHQSLLDEILG